MDRQCSQAVESLEISDTSHNCQKCDQALPIVGTDATSSSAIVSANPVGKI
jgi:hypothetical protein